MVKSLGTLALIAAVFVLAIVGLSGSTSADSQCTDTPDDGSGMPVCMTGADNECYEGGKWENQCDSEWQWSAGWYYARYSGGLISAEEVPAPFRSLMVSEGSAPIPQAVELPPPAEFCPGPCYGRLDCTHECYLTGDCCGVETPG